MPNGQTTTQERLRDDAETSEHAYAHSTSREWSGKHPVNLRLTVPFVGGGFYFTLLVGRERRSRERRVEERHKHPLFTTGNVLTLAFVGIGILLYVRMLWISFTSIVS